MRKDSRGRTDWTPKVELAVVPRFVIEPLFFYARRLPSTDFKIERDHR